MIIYLLLLLTFIGIFALLFKLIKFSNLASYTDLIITIICTILIINIVLKPKICLSSAFNGSKLFFNSVFVSLFPFLILINIMLSYDGVKIYSKLLGNFLCKPLKLPKNCSVVLIISILCGYPLGAKYACDLYEKRLIDFYTCNRLVNIASNPGPLFILGAVGTYMLNSSSLGVLLLISSYLSCIVMAFILPSREKLLNIHGKIRVLSPMVTNKKTLGDTLKSSIENAFKTTFSIGGFIIFFSVLTGIIKNNILFDIAFQKLSIMFNLEKGLLEGFFMGILEMTNGCSLTSLLNIALPYKLIVISFLLGFSGLSIISQTYSIIYKFKLSIGCYIKRKFLQGIICSIITIIIYKLNLINTSISTCNLNILNNKSFNIWYILIIQISVFTLPIFINKFFNLFKRIS